MINKAKSHLSQSDPIMEKLIFTLDELEISYREPSFESLIRIIINQQLSNKAASTIFGRLHKLYSNKKFTPEDILKTNIDQIRSCGLSNAKTRYIQGIANHLIENPLFIEKLKKMPTEDAYSSLLKLKGLGPWSVNIFLMFNLKQGDVFPYGDVSLHKAIFLLYGKEIDNKNKGAEAIISKWSPYKTIASLYLWHWIDSGQPEVI